MNNLSNSRMEALLRARVNLLEALKKFLLSLSIKIWRIKITRSVEDFLSHIGNFMKLMKAGAKKRQIHHKKLPIKYESYNSPRLLLQITQKLLKYI